MATIAIRILNILEQKIEPEKAKVIAQAIEEAIEENNRELQTTLATKVDIANLRTELVERISQSEVRILRWLVALWLTQMAAMLGILFKLFR